MIEKYRSEVLRFYEEKKASGELSMNLMYPTCANIRNEFRSLFNAGCDKLDNRILKEFLKIPFDKEISDLTVKKCDTETFKAFCNFLKKGIQTRERNIELLAWMIDFRPRPFSKYWRSLKGKTDMLSELRVTDSGVVEQNNMEAEALYHRQYNLPAQRGSYENAGLSLPAQQAIWIAEDNDTVDHSDLIPGDRFIKKEVTLEYPSGVKISVEAANLSLIAQLVRL